MNRIIFLAAAIVTVVFAGSAKADNIFYPGHPEPERRDLVDDTRVYIGLRGGISGMVAKSGLDIDSDEDMSAYSPVISLSVGTFMMEYLRLELEYTNYFTATEEKDISSNLGAGTESVRAKGEEEIQTVMLNLLAEYKSRPLLFRPYVGVGAGIAFTKNAQKLRGLSSGLTSSADKSETTFAANVKAGLLLPITESFAFDLSATGALIATQKPIITATGQLGIRLSF